jgi:hypothetical protein
MEEELREEQIKFGSKKQEKTKHWITERVKENMIG